MDSKEIQTRLDALLKAMLAKGLKQPSAQFDMQAAEVETRVYLRWQDQTKTLRRDTYSDGIFEFIRHKEPKKAFDNADAFIAKMPSAEEARLKQFMGALGAVIDLGKENGVEVEFLTPLKATMKKLSDNILTDQRMQPAE